MDGPSRARIVLGTVAVLVAALASLALLNVLLEEPLPLDDGEDGRDGQPGGSGQVFQPPDENGSEEGGGDAPPRKTNPCDTAEPLVRGAALATTVIAMGLWVLAVWWRQKRQTRVMNGWAIGALLVTLVATTLMFAWWIVHKVCSLDVFNLKSCLEIAHSLRNAFFLFLVAAIGLLGYAFMRARSGQRFWGLWSIAGSIFVYLSVLGLIGWIVAEDMCERQFKQPDDLPDQPNQPDDPDDPGNDTGNQGNQNGGNPGGGGLGGGQRGGGGGGGAAPALPQVSPFALLVLLGIAAVITIIVLAVKGRQDQQRAAAMAALSMGGMAGMLRLFMDTDVESNDAVVAAYRRFLDHCMLEGVAKNQNETPREHGLRAAKQLDLPYEEMLPLLDAYTHIRLAQGPLPEERRQAALGISRLWRPRAKARRVRKTGGGP